MRDSDTEKVNGADKASRYRWNATDAAIGYDQCAERIHPYYREVQNVILDAIPFDRDDPFVVVDAGGGSGRLIELVLGRFPNAMAIVLDQSEPFLAIAQQRLNPVGPRARCQLSRLQDDWTTTLGDEVHVVVSMSAIHHLDAGEKRTLYGRIHDLLVPGGVFLNGDEVRPASDESYLSHLRIWAEQMEQLIAEKQIPQPMYETLRGWIHRNVTRFDEPKHSGDDCHETIETQLKYLVDAGFNSVEVDWTKDLWCVFGGRK